MMTREEGFTDLGEGDLLCAQVDDDANLFNDPQFRHNVMVVEQEPAIVR